jgi:hypothetical protein
MTDQNVGRYQPCALRTIERSSAPNMQPLAVRLLAFRASIQKISVRIRRRGATAFKIWRVFQRILNSNESVAISFSSGAVDPR